MTKKNYTKYSESSEVNNVEPEVTPEVEPEVTPEVEPEVTPEVEPEVTPEVETQNDSDEHTGETDMEPEVEPEVEPEEIDEVEGIILPNRLNVRKEASKDSDVVCIVTKDTSVVVILTESTEGFYKVRTSDAEGYCMKEFIELK